MGGLKRVQVNAFSWTPHHRIVLSWDLIDCLTMEGRILCSYTNFITTPELSGPLYISPDINHTHICWRKFISEFFSLCIEHLPNCYSVRRSAYFLNRDRTFREHLSCALPTELNFYLLRSIPSEYLLHEYSEELMLETLQIIV